MKRTISRRQLLKTAAIGGTGALLAACAGAASTPQVIKETVVVEKEKTVQVTSQVEVTKEVQVTAAPVQGPQTLTVWGSGLDTTQIEKDPEGKTLNSGGQVQ